MRFYPIEVLQKRSESAPSGYLEAVIAAGTALFDEGNNIRAVMMTEKQYEEMAEKWSDAAKKAPQPVRYGPGTELKGLLSMVGIKASPNCSCNAKAKIMDDMGIEWCRQNTTEIVGWLQKEAEKRRLPFSRFAARKLVQTAIARAERKRPKTAATGA